MPWAHDVAAFFAAVFLTNAVPHFVKGVAGDRFPTPFARPPGRGLSSPTVNVLWSLFNLAVGGGLFRVGQVASGSDTAGAVFVAGVAVTSSFLSRAFAKKHVETHVE